jgi:hypothetical protein
VQGLAERGAGARVATRAGDGGVRLARREAERQPQPGAPEQVALRHGRAAIARPRIWVMMRHDIVHVGQLPAGRCEVECKEGLLGAEAEAWVEPAYGEKRLPADDRSTGHEAEHRRAG